MTGSIVHVVDDDEDARRGTARLLEAAGFDARTYASAGEFVIVDDVNDGSGHGKSVARRKAARNTAAATRPGTGAKHRK